MPVKTNGKHKGGCLLKYQPIMLVSIYRYAKLGMSEEAIAASLDIGLTTLNRWKRNFPEIGEAIAMGRTDTKDGGNWHQFIYDRLAPDLQLLWDKISSWDDLPNGTAKIEALLADHGKSVRQQLFLYALIHSNFSASRAMAKVNIARPTMNDWIKNDPAFAELIEEIQWHKGNFYEESLVNLVKGGDRAATIFANRTFNRERGYSVKDELNVHHSGQIEHTLDLSELDLTPQIRTVLMEAIRKREEKIAEERAKGTLPVEFRIIQEEIAELSDQEEKIDEHETLEQ